jgi:hypothetical protein
MPDNTRGYGLPDVTAAWIELGEKISGNGGLFSCDPMSGVLTYHFANNPFQPGDRIELRDMYGNVVPETSSRMHLKPISSVEISGLQDLPAGYYQIVLTNKERVKRMGAAFWR